MVSHLEVFHCERIKLYSKAKAWADFFILNILEAIIFQLYGFLQGHKVSQNDGYWSSSLRNVVAMMATKPEYFGHQRWDVTCIGGRISRSSEP